MLHYLFIAFGAACGGVGRYWISTLLQRHLTLSLPVGTLTVNILGSFLLGLLAFSFDLRSAVAPEVKVMLTIGLCGGFTTFSTFSFETIMLLRNAEYLLALINISLNIVLTLGAVALSFFLTQRLWGA